jgi:hypothetical protein
VRADAKNRPLFRATEGSRDVAAGCSTVELVGRRPLRHRAAGQNFTQLAKHGSRAA